MAVDIIMPKLGLTMTEGTILRWIKQDGDKVEKGEAVLEIMTDKTTMEIESPGSGVLRVIATEGSTVPILEVVGRITVDEDAAGDEGLPAAESTLTESNLAANGRRQAATEGQGERLTCAEPTAPADVESSSSQPLLGDSAAEAVPVKSSPAARRAAKELGLTDCEFRSIRGTGPGGRIVEEDVRAAASKHAARIAQHDNTQNARGTGDQPQVVPLTGVRGLIAERMSRSAREAPQFHVTVEMCLDQLVNLRKELLPEIERSHSVRISYTGMLVKIVAEALKGFPTLNSFVNDREVRVQPEVNIGVAVDSSAGLTVPTIYGARAKSVADICLELNDLVKRARDGSLLPDDLAGGTFTISNLGMLGVDEFAAILNPPQAAILAVGRFKPQLYLEDRGIVAHSVAAFTLTCDHRAADGALAARFLKRIEEIVRGDEAGLRSLLC
ncbi:MAG: 2-oxo acid dehydrogenase subunit E2 [Firmicutes bacterium]|nr:2-oxo acid dehydrogenase subunit E2 [Bacillota bacterium]